MATPRPSVQSAQGDARWKWLLLAVCAVAAITVVYAWTNVFGLGSRPWFGYWDGITSMTDRGYVLTVVDPAPDGAMARAGLRDGDRIDLREQSAAARVAIAFQPMATEPTRLIVRRDGRLLSKDAIGSTVWEGNWRSKVFPQFLWLFEWSWFLACAILITMRRWWVAEARILAFVMLFEILNLISPTAIVLPGAGAGLIRLAISASCSFLGSALLVALTSRFGVRYAWRRVLEWVAYAACAANLLGSVLLAFGLLTLRFDPLPYLGTIVAAGWYPWLWIAINDVAAVLVAVAALSAVACTPVADRTRAAWLLLPLPIALAAGVLVSALAGSIQSWVAYMLSLATSDVLILLGALAVTYALLNRRVLDFGFVLSRTVVVAAISLIVVSAFACIEWTLARVFSGLSQDATLYTGAAVTLALGLLMPKLYGGISYLSERYLMAREFRSRMQAARLAAGLPYADSSAAIATTLARGICSALDLPSAIVYCRGSDGTMIREASYGWHEDECLDAIDAQRLGMNLQVSRGMLRLADEYLESARLPSGDREPVVAFPLFARQALLGFVLYSSRSNGVALDPDYLRLLEKAASEASRGYDAVELAKRVEIAHREQSDAQRRHAEELGRINEAQARFMPVEFLDFLEKPSIVEVALGDSIQRRMTVLFSDIRSFTTISEGMSPSQIFAYLNRYLQRAEPIVSEHGGFIDKYIGDAIMGLFPRSADDALGAGITLQRDVRVLNRKLEDEGLPHLAIGVGLHTGELILGTIGGRNRMETTVIADAVNVASRLESATKTFGCSIVLSRETKIALVEPDRFLLRPLGHLQVKGKHERLEVYEAFDADPAQLVLHKQNTLEAFVRALELFEAGDFTAALAEFEAISRADPDDGAARYYVVRCEELRNGITAVT